MILDERERMILLDSKHLDLIPSMRRLLEALRSFRDTPSSLIQPPSMALKFAGVRVLVTCRENEGERREELGNPRFSCGDGPCLIDLRGRRR
jgi:hypothetical protein